MSWQRTNLLCVAQGAADNLQYWGSGRWRRCSPAPGQPTAVPDDFLGICVAAGNDPASDDFILAQLAELGLRHVRLDYSYENRGGNGERLLKKLLEASLSVCLHLVQPPAEVRAMPSPAAQERWRTFVAETFAAYAGRLELAEIGSVCNRRRWTGYTPATFLLSWQLAWEEARRQDIRLAAPNITDFEPFYNVAYLGALRRAGRPPEVHSNNLFVERALEPETYDHKIMGRRLAGLFKCNLVRKAGILADIGRWAGVPETIVPHVAWSLRRIARLLDHIEEKQADYLARYVSLAAAAGALRRVYWGPLIGQREGLVDDGTSDYPDLPHVAYYGQARGRLGDYRRRPAFATLQTANRFLAGAGFLRPVPTGAGLEILEFRAGRFPEPGRIFHVAWTTNGHAAATASCYPGVTLAGMTAWARDGQRLERAPDLITETPVYLCLPGGPGPAADRARPSMIAGLRLAAAPGVAHAPFRRGPWTGLLLTREAGRPRDFSPALAPVTAQAAPPAAAVLRAGRNRVWTVPDPGDRRARLVVKQFPRRAWWRRLLQPRRPDRARLSWNGAQELLRRGLPTPRPVAVVYAASHPARRESYYLCRYHENCWSARQAFAALNRGMTHFQGQPAAELVAALARFLHTLHARGVFFRDLSAGNLLLRCEPESDVEFTLIDTARARFYPGALGLRPRLADLMRLCHPLDWPGRDLLVGRYLQFTGRHFRWWLKIPFVYYDLKHRLKNAFKPLRPAHH